MTPDQEAKLDRFLERAELMASRLDRLNHEVANARLEIGQFGARFDRIDGNLLVLKGEMDSLQYEVGKVQNGVDYVRDLVGALNQIVTGLRGLANSTYDMVASHVRSTRAGQHTHEHHGVEAGK